MRVSPDAIVVERALLRAWRRALAVAALNGAAAGCVAALAVALALWLIGRDHLVLVAAAIVAAGASVAVSVTAARRSRWPRDLERRAPECRNAVVTAAELIADPARTRPGLVSLVCADAARRLDAIDWARTLPIGRAAWRVALAAALCGITIGVLHARPMRSSAGAPASHASPAISHVEVTVESPPYTNLPAKTSTDPSEVHAIAGSRLRLRVTSTAAAVTLETIDGRIALAPGADGRFEGQTAAIADGYLALEPATANVDGARALIGLVVDPDQPPIVHIDKPGRDLFVPNVATPLAIDVTAQDDLGLASLKLAYTKVTGSGENFSFAEGDIPVTMTRTDDRHWRATTTWNLAGLGLAPGDMVVYHAIAADRRPGAAPVPSDAFIVQVLTPNQAAAGGFSIDDDPNRFALSQRMVILKTEKLEARKATMAPSDVADEALGIAAEQRQVRAMFIFMMGGEFEDESAAGALNEIAEAESESDIAAGRLHNQARVDLMIATRHMSTAATSLAVPAIGDALAAERAALDAIQKAFSKDRYLLRTLSTEERIDLARRLSGTLGGVSRAPRLPSAPTDDPVADSLRRLLSRVAAAAARTDSTPARSDELRSLGDSALRVGNGSRAMQAVSVQLSKASTLVADPIAVRSALDQAAAAIAAALRDRTSEGPRVTPAPLQRIDGALADALRQRGGR